MQTVSAYKRNRFALFLPSPRLRFIRPAKIASPISVDIFSHLFSFECAICFVGLHQTAKQFFELWSESGRGEYEKFINMLGARTGENKTVHERGQKKKRWRIKHYALIYVNCIIIQLHKSYLIFFLLILCLFRSFLSLIMRISVSRRKRHRLGQYDNVWLFWIITERYGNGYSERNPGNAFVESLCEFYFGKKSFLLCIESIAVTILLHKL